MINHYEYDEADVQRIGDIIRHIKLVEANCDKIAFKIQKTDFDFARRLIQLGRIHDASKFDGYELKHLHADSPKFANALGIHHMRNKHHPEYWNDIRNMPEIYVAEMVCDCAARGQEFGSDVREWFEKSATVKYNFKMDDEVGQLITKYLDMLLTPRFKS